MSDIRTLDDVFEMRASTPPVSMAEFMKTQKDKKILLYGSGAFGRENLALFRRYGVEPYAFLDRGAEPGMEKMGIPVYHPDDPKLQPDFRRLCQVFISITLPKKAMNEVQSDLSGWGYQNVAPVQFITARQVKFDDSAEENPAEEYFRLRKERMERVLELMSDEESRETFLSCVGGHLLRDYASCAETDWPCQYFDAGVSLPKGFGCFVDCGAYTGDSLEAVLHYCNKLDTYIAFEPILNNFEKLSKTMSKLSDRVGCAFLYPCGVSDRTGAERFSLAASSSAVNENGELLPIVKLDDVLKNVPVTFLKMDIEGSELGAIRGAKELICRQRPDLAISVYHAVNHFWDIPYMIHEIVPDYRFYLRAHTPASLETVVYCTCGER